MVLVTQAVLLLMVAVKHLFPSRFRNTHSKLLGFLHVMNALNTHKHKGQERDVVAEVLFWVVFPSAIVQALLHGFKLSSFKRSKKAKRGLCVCRL